MCGIVGYTGSRPAREVLIEGLSKLEYRGYDSAGILTNENGVLNTVKCKGRLANLVEKIKDMPLNGTCGMGHTRWATHGPPSDVNSHPHGTSKVMLVHNGIIENYLALGRTLAQKGYRFTSETDTEIAAAVIDDCYKGDPIEAIVAALSKIEGSYALVIMFADFPKNLYAVRKDGPLIVAPGDGENFLASDVTAIIGYTNRFFTLEEGEIAQVTPEAIKITDFAGNEIQKQVNTVSWNIEQAEKDGFEHFMLKEIHEQPDALAQTINPRLRDGVPSFAGDGLPEGFFSRFSAVRIVACGTAMHAGLVGKHVIEELARVHVEVEVASEFRYRNPILNKNELAIIVSQSGETADTLAAMRLLKANNITTLAVVNVAGSSIAREADYVVHTYAGPEIAVASTKAYTVQAAVLYLVAFAMALENKQVTPERCAELCAALLACRANVKAVVANAAAIEAGAHAFKDAEHLFFLGRGLDHALACEGSLKLKEISYIHCEAYAAGELKHGTISLITEGVPVIALATQQALCAKMLSNIREVKARGAKVLLIAKKGEEIAEGVADILIELDALPDLLMPFPAAAALQLVAYSIAKARNCDIDKPRNLAKSVTVE